MLLRVFGYWYWLDPSSAVALTWLHDSFRRNTYVPKSTGLTDIGMGPGKTTNFLVQYEDSLPNQATVKANANALLAIVENEFTVTTSWFNTPAGKFGSGNRQVVNLNIGGGGGGNNSGYGRAINIMSKTETDSNSPPLSFRPRAGRTGCPLPQFVP